MSTSRPSYRLLLIEDNPGDVLLVQESLADIPNYSLSVDNVATLDQALVALKASSYDGIILDLTLPDSSGLDTLADVRAACSETPIIVFTGLESNTSWRESAETLGAYEFIGKHVDTSRFLSRSVFWMLRSRRAEVLHRQFEKLIGSMPDAVIVTADSGVIQFVNDAAVELFGKRREDFVGELLGFAAKQGNVAEIEIHRGAERRSCEIRVTECEWNGHPANLASIRDLTEQRRLSDQLQQAQKMEAVGLLAGGIAHDFNNLLLVMLVHAEMLRDDCDAEDPRLRQVVEIVQSIDRAQALTGQLLAFSRKQPSQLTVLNLSEVVTGIHSMLRRVLPANIEISTIAPDDAWPVLADKGQIEQVIMNLAVNSRDAMPDGGRFSIEVENHAIESTNQALVRGEYVAMRFSDTGEGIDAANLKRIFEPFFTTKERGRGTGLGLAMCYGIVAQAGGHITVDTEIGAGTSFTILLPRTKQPAAAETAPVKMERREGGEAILIVEDDQAVMRATSAALRKSGYTVFTAANGDEARRFLRRKDNRVDLVLSDVVMPQLSGPELAEYIRSDRPELPIVFMTGYSDYPIWNEQGDNRIVNCRAILKPFRPDELSVIVREALDGKAGADRAIS